MFFLAIGEKLNGTAPTLVQEMFPLTEKNSLKLRNRTNFAVLAVNCVRNGLEGLSCLGPKSNLNYCQNLKLKLTHFRPMFHLWINQVVGFY